MTKNLLIEKERETAKDPTIKLLFALSISVTFFIIVVLIVVDEFNVKQKQQQDTILNFYDKSIAETFNLTNTLHRLDKKISLNKGSKFSDIRLRNESAQLKKHKQIIIGLQQKYQRKTFELSVERLASQIDLILQEVNGTFIENKVLERRIRAALFSAKQVNLLHQQKRMVDSQLLSVEFSKVDSIIDGAILFVLIIGLPLTCFIFIRVKKAILQQQIIHSKLLDTHHEIERHAYYDSLTNLPNRRLFKENLESAIKTSARTGEVFGVFFLDIDNFKNINDSLGHDVGDTLLIEVSKRILNSIRTNDKLSRIGGDEFNILVADVNNDFKARLVAEKIINQLAEPFRIDNHEINVSVSIGITLLPNDSTDFSTLLKYADLAMYHVKSVGKNSYKFFNKTLNETAIANMQLEKKLKRAIENDEFVLYYQPQVNIKDKSIIGFEALIRWDDPEKGIISPQSFIPLAESTGLINQIGLWVISQVCRDLTALIEHTHDKIKVAINVSARQMQDFNLVSVLQQACESNQVSPSNIEIEITESMLMEDIEEKRKQLLAIQALGMGIAIDDFGTGYSSFSYLKKLPLNTLKIDRSFIENVCIDTKDKEIASGIIALAHSLHLKLVAEGVETQEQLTLLENKECDFYQGYLFSRPLPLNQLLKTDFSGRPHVG
ncbi:MAG: EAL domain-containing protein [Colwellia sp.]